MNQLLLGSVHDTMRARNILANSMSVTAWTTLVLLVVVVSSTATEAPTADIAHSACAKYADSPKHALCQQLIATLAGQQTGPAGPAVQPQHVYKRAPKDYYQQHDEYQHKETEKDPWYHHAPEYQQQQQQQQHEQPYRKDAAAEEPYFSYKQYPSRADYPSSYPQDSPEPPTFGEPEIETKLTVDLDPKQGTVNATGKLTQNMFNTWSVQMSRTVSLAALGAGSPSQQRLYVQQFFTCEAPALFGFEGTVSDPRAGSLTIHCNMVPSLAGLVDAGAKFPWKEALKPRNAIVVPNPTKLVYNGGSGFYTGNITSISSPIPFEGSIVELAVDVLLALPHKFAFSVAADAFVSMLGRAKQAVATPQCDNVKPAAAKLLCQHRADVQTDSAPVQHQVAGTAAAASPLYRRKPQNPPAYHHDQGASGGSHEDTANYHSPPEPPYGASKSPFLPDNYLKDYPKSDSGIAFIPQTTQSLNALVTPFDQTINATGDLTQDDFQSSVVYIDVTAQLSEKILFFDDNALLIDQVFECIEPVHWRFSGLVRGPGRFDVLNRDTIRIQCKMEPLSTAVLAGSRFPWSAAAQERYQVQVGQPQTASYSVNYPSLGADFEAIVPSVRSEIPFTGTYLDYMTQALLGKPAEFDFEVYLARLTRVCRPGTC